MGSPFGGARHFYLVIFIFLSYYLPNFAIAIIAFGLKRYEYSPISYLSYFFLRINSQFIPTMMTMASSPRPSRRPRRRPPSSSRPSSRAAASSFLLFAALSTNFARVSCGGGDGGRRFSSSIVTHRGSSDLSSSSSLGRLDHAHDRISFDDDAMTTTASADDDGRDDEPRLHRCDVDRRDTAINRRDDDDPPHRLQCGVGADNNIFDGGGREIFDRWRSPLEGLAPLPSLSLPFRECDYYSDVPPSHPSSVEIGPGPRHPHEIDVLRGRRRGRPTSSSSHSHRAAPRTRKTGTTIVALLARNSTVLILAADTRSTDGTTVADRRCEKLHDLADNVWCAGAGTSADVEALVRGTRHAFRGRARTGMGVGGRGGGVGNLADDDDERDGGCGCGDRASVTAVIQHLRTRLRESRGNLGANLLAGGYDAPSGRAVLAAVHPHGSVDVVSYSALGSGGLAAMGVLESRYPHPTSHSSSHSSRSHPSCTVAEGVRLAVDAVRAGIDNDLGSGSQVDVCVIGQGGTYYRRAVAREEELRWTTTSGGDHDDAAADVTFGGAGDGIDGDKSRISKRGKGIGVNGFGNVPFAIRSRRVVRGGRSDLDAERERRRWLDEVLSLE